MPAFGPLGLKTLNAPAAGGVVSPYKWNGRPFGVAATPTGQGRLGVATPGNIVATTMLFTNWVSQSVQGTPSALVSSGTRPYIQFQSGAVSGNSGGYAANNPDVRANFPWVMGATFRVDATAAMRMYIGLAEAGLTATTFTTAPAASTNDGLLFGYDSAQSSGAFRLISCDGTNASATVFSSITPTVGSEYHVQIDNWTEMGTAGTARLWDLTAGTYEEVRKTTNLLSTSNAILLYHNALVTTTEAVAKNLHLADMFFFRR